MMEHVALLMLTRDQLELTAGALDSYASQGWPATVVLLDNGTGGDAEGVARRFADPRHDLETVQSRENLGVAGGRNLLARRVSREWLVFVDNDVTFTPELTRALESLTETTADLVFPIVLDREGRVATAGGRYRRWLSWSSNGYHGSSLDEARSSLESAADWGGGACLIVRRSVFLELGGFDSGHGIYGAEDLDFCLRARRRGFKAVRSPHAPVVHLNAMTSIADADRRSSLSRGAALVRQRHGVPLTRPIATAWYRLRRSRALAPIKAYMRA
jgi:GT2 family glycosyltransferase